MKSRAYIIALIPLILCGCTMWRAKAKPGWSAATSADQYERLMWEAIQEQDYPQVERHLSATFVQSRPTGTLDRATVLQQIRLMRITSFEMSDVQTAPAGNDTIVTYMLVLHGTIESSALPSEPMRVMAIWQTTSHGWMAVAQSFTPSSQVTRSPGQ
jgi:ketosteroid isomerase-like protein